MIEGLEVKREMFNLWNSAPTTMEILLNLPGSLTAAMTAIVQSQTSEQSLLCFEGAGFSFQPVSDLSPKQNLSWVYQHDRGSFIPFKLCSD